MTGDLEKKQSELHRLRSSNGKLKAKVDRLRNKLKEERKVVLLLDRECNGLLQDYCSCAAELKAAREELDRERSQVGGQSQVGGRSQVGGQSLKVVGGVSDQFLVMTP